MKKVLFLLVAVLFIFTFLGCGKEQVSEQPKREISIGDRNITLNEDPVKDLKMKYPGPELPENNIYVNEECGYKFVFPEEWTNWYFVNDEIPEIATIRFYGKSIRGTILEKELLLAEKKEIKAKKACESATEYRQLCEQKLNEAKHDEEIKG